MSMPRKTLIVVSFSLWFGWPLAAGADGAIVPWRAPGVSPGMAATRSRVNPRADARGSPLPVARILGTPGWHAGLDFPPHAVILLV